jgi:hypothetical protein
MSPGKPQTPHHPFKVQNMNCFTAKACVRWLPLLSITLQGCTPFRHLSFHSVHCQPPASAPTQECFHSFHSAQADPPFHFAPLWLPNPQPVIKAKTGSSIPPNPIRYFLFSHHTCFSPCQPAVCPAVLFAPVNQGPQNSPPPFNGAGKNNGSFAHGFMLAAGSSHSFNRSLWRSYLASPLSNSFRSPHQLQHPRVLVFRASTPTLSPPTTTFLLIFSCGIVYPIKPHGSQSLMLCSAFLGRFIMQLKMRITAHTPPRVSYFPFFNCTSALSKFVISFFKKKIFFFLSG